MIMADDNPSITFLDSSVTNNPSIIAMNPKVVAINSAVEVDLTGQVCADSIGKRIISGVGGQVDFGLFTFSSSILQSHPPRIT